jgi:copper chaperone
MTKTITIKIEGMTCGHCEKTVKNEILKLDGVSEAKVSQSAGIAEVTFDDAKVSEMQIKNAVNETEIYKAI